MTPHSAFRIPHSQFGRGQASMELTVAFAGALLLLFASVKIFLWVQDRLITRQQKYDCTRASAVVNDTSWYWNYPYTAYWPTPYAGTQTDPTTAMPLDIFGPQKQGRAWYEVHLMPYCP